MSNPPFNLIPESLGGTFTKYGYGGPDGLAVTRLFMRQAIANLEPRNGEIVVYSQFGLGKNGRPLFESMLRRDVPVGTGIRVSYATDPLEHLQYGIHARNLEQYAERMSGYLKSVLPNEKTPDAATFAKALREAGVEALAPRVAYLKVDGSAPPGFSFD